jgi:hypothetical protein
MKNLLLIFGLFFSGGLFAESSMDSKCVVPKVMERIEYIKANCERNNILVMYNFKEGFLATMISEWCRYDRQIYQSPIGANVSLTCVLYSNEPRITISKE